jgi:hypothetical protein
LSEAEARLGQAHAAVRAAAKAVVGALIDAQAEATRQQLTDLLQHRTRLQQLASWWPDAGGGIKLAPSTLEFLTSAPDFGAVRVGIDNGAPPSWTDLLDRLISGDAEAIYEAAPAIEAAANSRIRVSPPTLFGGEQPPE